MVFVVVVVHRHSPWTLVKEGQCRLQSPDESLEGEALEKGVGEWLLGSRCWDIP